MHRVFALLIFVGTAACSTAPPDPSGESASEGIGHGQDALRISLSPHAFAFDVVRSANLIHGVAGDRRFIFVTEPLHGRVTVHDRFTGAYVADVPAPPGGFLLPFTLRSPHDGRLVVLDSGGFPDPATPTTPRLHEYDYTSAPFEATLVRSIVFDGLPVGFSEDFELTGDGAYVVSDSVIGSLWIVESDGTIVPGLVPSSGGPSPGLAHMAPCVRPPSEIEGIVYDLGDGYAPGIGSLAFSEGYLYYGTYCHGGAWRVPMATLRDTTRSAEVRAAEDIESVSAAPSGSADLLKGLTFNRFDPHDDSLYAADAFGLRIVRIDVTTGARTVISSDPTLYNFPVSAAFLPPVVGFTPLVVASDQEHRLDVLNAAIDTDLTEPPFLVAKVYVH